jgi:NitT/TauT family transport system permease protein
MPSDRVLWRGAGLDRALTVLLPTLTALVFLCCWQAVATLWAVPQVILPTPRNIAHQLVAGWADLLYQASFTAGESIAACLLSGVLGAAVAIMLAASALLREMLYPNLVAFQLVPKIALAPLFVIWLGIDSPSRLTFSTFISFFPVTISTFTGLLGTDRSAIRLCQSLTATPSQIFRHVQVPYALPFFFSGMKVAATLSVIGIIVGEFISSKHGLGAYILLAGSRAETARIFAALVVLCVIGLALYGAVAGLEMLARKAWRG